MSDPVIDRVRQLRAMGATKVHVTADGAIDAEFGPAESSRDEDDQHDAPKPTRRLSATGGLVPRADSSNG